MRLFVGNLRALDFVSMFTESRTTATLRPVRSIVCL